MKKTILKKISKAFLSLMLCLTLIGSYSTHALAYSDKDYEVDEEGDYKVSNMKREDATVKVAFYLLVQEDYANAEFMASYNFYCTEGVFIENGVDYGHGGLRFPFRSQNATSYYYQTIEGVGDIWAMQFVIEPGTYLFAEPGGLNGITILPTSLGSPFVDDGYTEAEEVVVKDGDEIQLYGTYGEWDWRSSDEALKAIQDFAKEKERQLLTYSSTPSVNTIEVENDSELPEEVVEEPTEEVIEEIPESESEQSVESQPVFKESPEQEPQKDSKVSMIFSGILILAVLAGCFWIKKKDDDKKGE